MRRLRHWLIRKLAGDDFAVYDRGHYYEVSIPTAWVGSASISMPLAWTTSTDPTFDTGFTSESPT